MRETSDRTERRQSLEIYRAVGFTPAEANRLAAKSALIDAISKYHRVAQAFAKASGAAMQGPLAVASQRPARAHGSGDD